MQTPAIELLPQTADLAIPAPPADGGQERQFQQLKTRLHQQLIESLDLPEIEQVDPASLRTLAAELIADPTSGTDQLAPAARARLLDELLEEVFGLGPLECLMRDPDVTDILVNDDQTVYVERNGRLQSTSVVFADERHLMRIIQRLTAKVGRRIDEASPMVDARLPDGSRVNAVVPPLALNGPTLSIRRFSQRTLTLDHLVAGDSLTEGMSRFLQAVVEARIGCLISGSSGAGKTTLLNAMSAYVPDDERLVTIEDSAELKLHHRHWVRLETRDDNHEGRGEISQRDLVRNSLRMRPDRIIIGEVRGPEVWDMLQAMNTGHAGWLTTIHANTARDALARMEMMVAMTGFEMPVPVVREYIAAAINIVIHVVRLKGGRRKIVGISELQGASDGQYRMQEIFSFRQTGRDAEGAAAGSFHTSGIEPQCCELFQLAGIDLPAGLFHNAHGAGC